MWSNLAAELGIPWRAAEAMHWQLGEAGMASRAGVTPFSLASNPIQARHSSYQPTISGQQPSHHRGHSDPPPHDSLYFAPHVSQIPHDGRTPRTPLTLETEGLHRWISREEQSHRILPSMAELDRGLTAAAMADARRNAPPRR